jgi:hypothetical protein
MAKREWKWTAAKEVAAYLLAKWLLQHQDQRKGRYRRIRRNERITPSPPSITKNEPTKTTRPKPKIPIGLEFWILPQ